MSDRLKRKVPISNPRYFTGLFCCFFGMILLAEKETFMKNRARWNLPLRMIGTTCFMFGGFGINFSTIPTWFATLLMVVGISLAIIAIYREKRMLPPVEKSFVLDRHLLHLGRMHHFCGARNSPQSNCHYSDCDRHVPLEYCLTSAATS